MWILHGHRLSERLFFVKAIIVDTKRLGALLSISEVTRGAKVLILRAEVDALLG